jgi:hypothetical protein
MPSVNVHCAISKKRTGNEFAELHEWIDKSKKPGPDHRVKRHYYNVRDRNQIKKQWGEKAMIEWLFHIAIDNLDTAYKMSRQSFSYGMVLESQDIFTAVLIQWMKVNLNSCLKINASQIVESIMQTGQIIQTYARVRIRVYIREILISSYQTTLSSLNNSKL